MSELDDLGWIKFAHDPALVDWVGHAYPAGLASVTDPALHDWHQCQGTWFVGVDALPNDAAGRVGRSEALAGSAVDFLGQTYGWPDLHKAQVSDVYEGYPKPREGESDAGFKYRLNRDAAHVDGVLGLGTPKRRFVKEPHSFILGIPLNDAPPEAAPMVVWEGSHKIMQAAFRSAFAGCDPAHMSELDVTEAYVAARRDVFETCKRVVVHAKRGECYAVHRFAVHGVAPWAGPAMAEGRMIAYFRPQIDSVQAWLEG